jgi:hypothetical protein
MAMAIPSGVEAITADWLTGALRVGDPSSTAVVDDFDLEPIGLGVGVMSVLFRITPRYAEGDGPATLIVKLAPPYDQVRAVAAGYRFYEREVAVYNNLCDDLVLRPPRCWYAAHDLETGDFALVLEDLCDHRVADQLEGCTPEDAELVVLQTARQHAKWWGDPRLTSLPFMQSPAEPPYPQFQEENIKQCWPVFLERFGDRVSDRIRVLGDNWADIGPNIMRDTDNHPTTLNHGDLRLDNIFFDDASSTITLVDWQIAFRANGLSDLAYFMSQSLTVDDRRAHEDRLVHLYHETLMSGGVKDYGFDELWTDYRTATLFCLAYPLSAGALELVNDRAVDLVNAMFDRSVAAIEDLDADELVPG